MYKRYFRQFFLALIFTVLLTACGGTTEPPALEISLTALDIEWDITNIDAVVGQTITISIKNEGSLDHNLEIAAWGIDIDLPAGTSDQVTLVVTEAGSLEFFCNVPGHYEAGMVGTITVSE